jgi:hypothetical protein
MQEVQEKEVANQDPYDLVMSRQTSTVSRVAERLALLKSVFIRSKTPKMTGIIPGPYRKDAIDVYSFDSCSCCCCFLWKDGFAFSQEEDGVVPQDQLIRNCDTNIQKPLGI